MTLNPIPFQSWPFLTMCTSINSASVLYRFVIMVRKNSWRVKTGVTKRCRLSWLTNSALVYEPKCRGIGRGSQPMSAAVHMEPKKPNWMYYMKTVEVLTMIIFVFMVMMMKLYSWKRVRSWQRLMPSNAITVCLYSTWWLCSSIIVIVTVGFLFRFKTYSLSLFCLSSSFN